MGIFGKKDKTQDQQLKDLWKWIDALNKNQAILIKNNNVFIQKNKNQAKFNDQVTKSVNALVEKDRQHDRKDAEHDALISGVKAMSKAVEKVETE